MAPKAKKKPETEGQADLVLALSPLFAAMGCLVLMLLSGAVPSLLLLRPSPAGTSAALALLRACRTGHLAAVTLRVACPVLYLLSLVWIFRVIHRRGSRETLAGAMAIASSVLLFFAVVAVTTLKDDPFTLQDQFKEDIRQLEAGLDERSQLFLYPVGAPDSMPGLEDRVLTRRRAIGPDTGWRWFSLAFPDTLDFSPEPEGFFDETRDPQWNLEHGQLYELTYTSNFHLVASAAPVAR